MKRIVIAAFTVACFGGCRDYSQIRQPISLTDGGGSDHPSEHPSDASCVLDQSCLAPPHGSASCANDVCTTICDPGYEKVGADCRLPSCASLAANCSATRNDDCCAYDDVPGGSFVRGYDMSGASMLDGMPVAGWQSATAAAVKVDAFSLGRYEVTVGRFRAFLADYDRFLANNPDVGAGGDPHNLKAGWQCGWRGNAKLYSQTAAAFHSNLAARSCNPKIETWLTDPARANDDKPMTCVNWYEAYLFCIWDSARLPTDAEWNFAAAGGDMQRAYPWGTPDVLDVNDTSYANVGSTGADIFLDDVGSHPKGKARWGQMDLAGNASELVLDGCGNPNTYSTEATDPVDSDKVAFPNDIARGGSYKYPWLYARTGYRLQTADGRAYDDLGWRCAMPVAIGTPVCNGTGGSGGTGGAGGAGGAVGLGGSGGKADGGTDAPPCDTTTHHLCGSICAANGDVARCGPNCLACTTPTGGTTSCTNGVCTPACTGSNHLCNNNTACVANDTNACGSSCIMCVAPTNGTVSCDGTKCVPACNAHYHSCTSGGPCVANDTSACGSSCTPCPASTAATTYTCNETACVSTCNTTSGFIKCPDGSCQNNFSLTSCGPNCYDCTILGWPTRCDGTSCCDDGTRCEAH